MSPQELDQVRGLQENKIQLLEEILSYSKIQAGLSCSEQAIEFTNLLETRQRCIDSLKELENTLQSMLGPKGTTGNQAFDKQIAAFKDKADAIIQEIMALDREQIILISNEMQNTQNKLNAVHQGRKGIAGYAGSQVNMGAAFTDSRK